MHNRLATLRDSYVIICFVALVAVFVATGVPELMRPLNDAGWENEYITASLNDCNNHGLPYQRAVLKFYQFCVSEWVFGNHKVITFAESVGMLFLVYLITVQVTGKKYSGLISAAVLAGSHTFFGNAPTGYFSVEWVFFLLLSMWLVFKRPEASGLFYCLSLFAKGITLLYYPFIIWFIYRSALPKRHRIVAISSVSAVIPLTILWTVLIGQHIIQPGIPMGYQDNLLAALYNPIWNFTEETRDHVYLYGLIPLSIIGLYSMRKQFTMAWPLAGMIVYMFSMQVWLPMFSGYGMGNYRNVAMMALVAVSLGILSNHKKQAVIHGCFYVADTLNSVCLLLKVKPVRYAVVGFMGTLIVTSIVVLGGTIADKNLSFLGL